MASQQFSNGLSSASTPPPPPPPSHSPPHSPLSISHLQPHHNLPFPPGSPRSQLIGRQISKIEMMGENSSLLKEEAVDGTDYPSISLTSSASGNSRNGLSNSVHTTFNSSNSSLQSSSTHQSVKQAPSSPLIMNQYPSTSSPLSSPSNLNRSPSLRQRTPSNQPHITAAYNFHEFRNMTLMSPRTSSTNLSREPSNQALPSPGTPNRVYSNSPFFVNDNETSLPPSLRGRRRSSNMGPKGSTLAPHPSAVAATSAAIAVVMGSGNSSPSSAPYGQRVRTPSHSRGGSNGTNSVPNGFFSGSSKVSTPNEVTEVSQPLDRNLNLSNSVASSTATNPSGLRQHKRKPSLATLWAFAEGVEHHTRVRGVEQGEGRGFSRSASPNGWESPRNRRSLVRSPGGYDEPTAADLRPSISTMDGMLGIPMIGGIGNRSDRHNEFPFNPETPVGLLGIKRNSQRNLRSRSSYFNLTNLGPMNDENEIVIEDNEFGREGDETIKEVNVNYISAFEESILHPIPQEFSPEDHFLDLPTSSNYGYYDSEGDFQDDYCDPSYSVPEPFKPGDRIAVGRYFEGSQIRDFKEFEETQRLEREKAESEGEGRDIEVVRVLGTGTYAIVYLVREVVYDPSRDSSKDSTLDDFQEEIIYGREYALKCLSKKDLSDDLLLVQRSEVTLHKSLPVHPNIVTLLRAYENDSWLFILMDYTPGQDLFFWLHERANAEAHNHLNSSNPPINNQHTPPSPSLLASTGSSELLSRPRLRLISRMFIQMCSAVAAAHELGISHRDIKPENFIVMEDVDDGKVVVKLTDWGLGTNEKLCTDFDTGSKPYMSYECRNNLHPSYDPRKADIWSLGICLINMLFHRSPWFDPTDQDKEFSEFREAPVRFLTSRFEGIGKKAAEFLVNRVFCDILEGYQRVTAREFAGWAENLVENLGGGKKRGNYSSTFTTIPLTSIVSRPSMAIDPRLSSIFQAHFVAMPSVPRPNFAKQGHIPEYTQNAVARNLLAQYAPIPEVTSSPPASPQLEAPIIPPAMDNDEEVLSENGARSPSEGSTRSKRRKRGARRSGRSRDDDLRSNGEMSPPLPLPPSISIPVDSLNDLAAETQDFARKISKTTKRSHPELNVPNSAPIASSDHLSPQKPNQKKSSFATRMRNLVKDGNPDLEFFKAQVAEKNAALGIISAPAKMQHNRSGASELSSLGTASVGTSSWGSWTSDNSTQEKVGNKNQTSAGSHWASASNRRTRLEQKRHEEHSFPYRHPNHGNSGAASSSSVVSPLSSFGSIDSKPLPYRPPAARKENHAQHLESISEKSIDGTFSKNHPYKGTKDAATSTSSLPRQPEKTKLARILDGVKGFNKPKASV